jgi:hypothetical protein
MVLGSEERLFAVSFASVPAFSRRLSVPNIAIHAARREGKAYINE